MRELTQFELNEISGGLSCLDPATYKKLHNTAKGEAVVFSMLTVPILGAGAYALLGQLALTSNPVSAGIAIGVAVSAAPYIFALSYFNSNTWAPLLAG